jgi:hypothetical protein
MTLYPELYSSRRTSSIRIREVGYDSGSDTYHARHYKHHICSQISPKTVSTTSFDMLAKRALNAVHHDVGNTSIFRRVITDTVSKSLSEFVPLLYLERSSVHIQEGRAPSWLCCTRKRFKSITEGLPRPKCTILLWKTDEEVHASSHHH